MSYTGLKLSYQSKVEASNGVDSGVRGPHCREYFPHGVEVFLQALFLIGVYFGDKDSCKYPLSKNMEEWHWVLDYRKV